MPDNLQLYANRCRIQPETATGAGGDGSNVFDSRLKGAEITREVGSMFSRIDPWQTREFSEPKHIAWGIEVAGELRGNSLLSWLVDRITTAGASERGMTVREIRHDAPAPGSFAIQFDGIEGVSTFYGCQLYKLSLRIQSGQPQSFSAAFAGLTRGTTETAWTGTTTDSGLIVTAPDARIALASAFGQNPDGYAKTVYEVEIEIGREGVAQCDFSPDGVARGHTPGLQWDVVGRLLMPETLGITDGALGANWNGKLNIMTTSAALMRLELDLPITAQVNRRTGIAADWKQAVFEFVSRRGSGESIIRFIRDF